MNAQRLNSISSDIFNIPAEPKNTVRVCSANGEVSTINREQVIAMGRLATVEYFGKAANATPVAERYNHRVKNYHEFQKSVWKDTLLYCAARANAVIGKEPYSTMEELRADRSMYKNGIFLNALSTITQEVITPLFPAIIPDATERLIDWRDGRLGETTLIDIESNDFFLFDDDSWGSVSSKPYQYLYKSQIALTPKPVSAKTKIKWLQDVVDGEAGRYYAAFMRGAYNKMYAETIERFKSAMANTRYVPTGMSFDSYTADNWNKAVMIAAAVNGVRRDQLMAMGTLDSLSHVLPTVGTPGVVAGIQGMIGDEWVRNGFLGNVAGVDLVETGLAVVPGTQNYDPQFIGLDDETSSNIYIMAKIGNAPMAGVIAEGSPITIEFSPRETADMAIDISETIVFDIAPAISSKIVKISV